MSKHFPPKILLMVGASILALGVVTTGVALSQTGDIAQPPPADIKALYDQPRIAVADSHGVTRGTIPTAVWKATMDPRNRGTATEPTNTPVPVLNERGATTGYWIPTYGFVESDVVESPEFDVDTFVQQADIDWWNSLSAEEKQELQQEGVQPPQ